MTYPKKLNDIITLFEGLSELERRETLIAYADQAKNQEPKEGELFDFEDTRKDEECTDSVGIYLRADEKGALHFRIKLGPQVQTLTRAMSSILCKGLEGLSPEQLQEVPQDFVPKIVGAELIRIRSQTVYYLLTRMKTAAKVWVKRSS
ncbi:MAG: SufE family protein [Chthoniobacterales bacterium]|nr:SufE family protein [Chthoniobacterales bacterium]